MRTASAAPPFSVKRFAAALGRVAGGTLFFVVLAATLGLPSGKRPPMSSSALAGSQPSWKLDASENRRHRSANFDRTAVLKPEAGTQDAALEFAAPIMPARTSRPHWALLTGLLSGAAIDR